MWKVPNIFKKVLYFKILYDNIMINFSTKGGILLENREVSNVGKFISEFIGGILLYGILFGFAYSLISFAFYFLFSKHTTLYNIINIIIESIYVYFVYKFSINSFFKKRTIDRNDFNDLIKKYMIVSIVVFVLSAIINFANINSNANEVANSRSMKSMENALTRYYNETELANYYKEKEDTINTAKTEAYINLFFSEIIFGIFYFYIVSRHKNTIENNI